MARSVSVAPGGAAWQGATPSGRFPVSVSGRSVLDQFGDPWFGVGDAPWSLVGQLSPSEITTFLEQRASLGYRLMMITAPEFYYADNAPNNYNNDAPFTGTAFASSLNEAYWGVVDHAVDECARLDITALLCPAYYGQVGPSDGVIPEFTNATVQNAYDYGLALGTRYGGSPNVMWLAGHDDDPASYSGLVARYESLQDGIQAAGDTHLWIPGSGSNTEGRLQWGTTNMEWDADTVYYRQGAVVDAMHASWARTPNVPILFIEGWYENEFGITQPELRYQAWGGIVGGGFTSIYGHSPTWHFNAQGGDAWETTQDDPGIADQQHLADTLAATNWGDTVPDTTGTFLTSGAGSGTTEAGARYGGSHALVYMPTTRAITLDLTELSGSSFTITRIDPTNGATSVLTTTASGSGHSVSSPGTNSDGDSDWALTVEVT